MYMMLIAIGIWLLGASQSPLCFRATLWNLRAVGFACPFLRVLVAPRVHAPALRTQHPRGLFRRSRIRTCCGMICATWNGSSPRSTCATRARAAAPRSMRCRFVQRCRCPSRRVARTWRLCSSHVFIPVPCTPSLTHQMHTRTPSPPTPRTHTHVWTRVLVVSRCVLCVAGERRPSALRDHVQVGFLNHMLSRSFSRLFRVLFALLRCTSHAFRWAGLPRGCSLTGPARSA